VDWPFKRILRDNSAVLVYSTVQYLYGEDELYADVAGESEDENEVGVLGE